MYMYMYDSTLRMHYTYFIYISGELIALLGTVTRQKIASVQYMNMSYRQRSDRIAFPTVAFGVEVGK